MKPAARPYFWMQRMRRILAPLLPNWIADYQVRWVPRDMLAGLTLAAYAVPVSLAYAGLAGLPPQVGIYGYLLGGLGYALIGSSRQLAIGPTSAISLMIASTVGEMAGGDILHYGQIATLAAFAVALLCLIGWALRLSVLVRLISDSVLAGFKAGAGLTIMMTQLPSLFGTVSDGHNFFERVVEWAAHLGDLRPAVLGISVVSIVALLFGERFLPGKPVGLAVVVLSIALVSAFGLTSFGIPVTGDIPAGLPYLAGPPLRLRDVEGIFPLALGCVLLAYIEGVSVARNFATKHGYSIDPGREFLGLGAANLAVGVGQGYPVAGGLSQSAVNDMAGARSPIALVFASLTLCLCLLFLTGFLSNLPTAVLGAIVVTAVYGLVDIAALKHMWRASRIDFLAATLALASVLLLGILQGILLAAVASVLLLLGRASIPHVAFLGRIPGTQIFSDTERHPENEPLTHVLAFRPESSLLYINADNVLDLVRDRLNRSENVSLVVCDLSASPYLDLAGSRMLHRLYEELLARGIQLCIVGARGRVRDLLRADGVGAKVKGLNRRMTLADAIASCEPESGSRSNLGR
jgi:high affinity sulfate transporter 1